MKEQSDQVNYQASSAEGSSTAAKPLVDYPMENDWEYVHGRVDPGVDESIHLVEGVSAGEAVPQDWHQDMEPLRGKKRKSSEGLDLRRCQGKCVLDTRQARLVLPRPRSLTTHHHSKRILTITTGERVNRIRDFFTALPSVC